MAKGNRITFRKQAAREILNSPAVVQDIKQRTEAVQSACNAESSWGGYESEVDRDHPRPVGRVWSIGRSDRPGGDRALRMVKNLDAGR